MVSITEINALGRYETLEVVMQTVVDLQHQPNNLWQRLCGTDKLLLIAGGEAVAGFDLAKVRPEDVQVRGKSLSLTLPPAEIFNYFVKEDQTRRYPCGTAALCVADPNLETSARHRPSRRSTTGRCNKVSSSGPRRQG